MTRPEPGRDETTAPRPADDWSELLTVLLVLAAAHAMLPVVTDLASMSDRGHAMRAVVAVATLLLDVALLVLLAGRRTPRIRLEAAGVAVFSVIALFTVRWSAVGWGVVGALGILLVPALGKLAANRSS